MRWQEEASDAHIEHVESEIWDAARGSIATGSVLAVSSAAKRIARAGGSVSEAEIVEILVLAAASAHVPVELGPECGVAPQAASSRTSACSQREIA